MMFGLCAALALVYLFLHVYRKFTHWSSQGLPNDTVHFLRRVSMPMAYADQQAIKKHGKIVGYEVLLS